MPDPGRGERLNVGVLVWTDDDFRLQIDQKAVQRVIRENPRLERDSLLYLDPSLHASLTADTPVREKVETLLAEQKGFPTDFTEPRFTTVGDAGGLDQALEDLVGRVVRPKRRYGGGGLTPVQAVERQLRPLLVRGAVERGHFFQSSSSGVARTADFYANSSVNTALDALRLSVTKADDIRARADAEAFKVYDVMAKNAVRYAVYCEFSDDRGLRETNESARQVIESTGANVLTDIAAVADTMSGK